LTQTSSVASADRIDRRRTGRPTQAEVAELEDRLHHAALDAFLERGYDGTTIEAIASAAGITRRTLYARFPDKRALYVAVITQARTRLTWDQPDFTVDFSDLRSALSAIARSAVARAVNPEVVRLERVVMTESGRFPELVIFGRSTPLSPRMQTVMDLLRRHESEGTITIDDLDLAAEQFLAMVSLMPARLAAVGVYRPQEVEERHIEHAVTLFLRGVLAREPGLSPLAPQG
jgi:AcrR family transcriptional regulator